MTGRILSRHSRRAMLAAVPWLLAVPRLARALDRIRPVEFTTGSPTGGWFPVAAAMAELTNRHYEGQPVSVIPSAGAVANVVRVGRGQSEFGISYAPFLRLGMEGRNELYRDAYPELRAMFAGTYNMLHFVVAADSRIRAASDIRAQRPRLRLGTGPTGSTELFSTQQLFLAMGMNMRDLEGFGGRVELLPTSGRSDGWMNRQLDIAVFFINPPAAEVTEMMNARASTILSIDEPLREALVSRWGYQRQTLPRGTYPGQNEDVQTLGMPYIVFTRANVDETLVYRFTRSVAEGKPRLEAVSSGFRDWDPRRMHEGLAVPLHPGAERYYREVGLVS